MKGLATTSKNTANPNKAKKAKLTRQVPTKQITPSFYYFLFPSFLKNNLFFPPSILIDCHVVVGLSPPLPSGLVHYPPQPFSPNWCSHKLNGPAAQYELGVCIKTG
jgi:hypothetical protein